MKLLLFDIDGTLLLSRGLGLESLHSAIEEVLGHRGSADVRPDGKTDPQIIRELLAGVAEPDRTGVHDRILEVYVGKLERALSREPGRLYALPGVVAAVSRLHHHGELLLGVATGNIERAAHLKLQAGGLSPYFGVGGFGSDSADRTQLICTAVSRAEEAIGSPPTRVVVIGDTPRDVEHGRAAGAITVGVATGSYGVSELQECGADLVLESLVGAEEDLLKL